MSWSVTTPPSAEPVTLEEAKLHLRVDVTDDDTLISALIEAARQHVEAACQRALMPQVWTLSLAQFPASPCAPVAPRTLRWPSLDQLTILLPGGVVRAVDFVKYVDAQQVLQTLDPSSYMAELTADPAKLAPAVGAVWPTVREQLAGVRIQYQVGYADAAGVPAALRAAVLLVIGDLYANREAAAGQPITENPSLSRLLDPYKRFLP